MKESEYTPIKQREFRRVLGAISGIVGARSVNRESSLINLGEIKFVYIDLYSGNGGHPCGWGSPITAIEICEETMETFGLEYELHFYENDHDSAVRLDNIIRPFTPAQGCSIRIHEEDCVNVLDLEIPSNSMGLVYADPYGNCEYIPYLTELSKRNEYSGIDFLMNANASSIKRINGAVGKCNKCLHGASFHECTSKINKRFMRVRDRHGAWQWTMVLLTNTRIFDKKEWGKHRWYTMDESEMALSKVSKTRSEK